MSDVILQSLESGRYAGTVQRRGGTVTIITVIAIANALRMTADEALRIATPLADRMPRWKILSAPQPETINPKGA